MIQIGNYIISYDLLEKKFSCDLPSCLGNCCRYGDAGAPLTDEEVEQLRNNRDILTPYLTEKGRLSVELFGTATTDIEGEHVTPLIDGEECAYAVSRNGVLVCAVEKAWEEGKTDFRKPLSCHLFPARVKKFDSFTAVNVEEWPLCSPARERGKREGIFLYRFLSEALTRIMGKDGYGLLAVAAEELENQRKKEE